MIVNAKQYQKLNKLALLLMINISQDQIKKHGEKGRFNKISLINMVSENEEFNSLDEKSKLILMFIAGEHFAQFEYKQRGKND